MSNLRGAVGFGASVALVGAFSYLIWKCMCSWGDNEEDRPVTCPREDGEGTKEKEEMRSEVKEEEEERNERREVKEEAVVGAAAAPTTPESTPSGFSFGSGSGSGSGWKDYPGALFGHRPPEARHRANAKLQRYPHHQTGSAHTVPEDQSERKAQASGAVIDPSTEALQGLMTLDPDL